MARRTWPEIWKLLSLHTGFTLLLTYTHYDDNIKIIITNDSDEKTGRINMLRRIKELIENKTYVCVGFKSGNFIYGKFKDVKDGMCLFDKMEEDKKEFQNSEFSYRDIERIES